MKKLKSSLTISCNVRAAFFTPSPSFLHSSKSRRQALHRRAAEALVEAKSQPEAIAHHFTQAGLDDLAIEWWGKTGDEALHRSAFKEAISHLGKAIAMADKAGSTTRQANTGSAAPSGRLTQLHVAYGNALMAARGFAAPETTGAFAKARESAFGAGDAPGRLEADYGLWAGSYSRGDLPTIRAHAAAFLNDIEGTPDSPEAGVAHRAAGATCLSSPFPRSVFLVILEYVAATIAQPARVAVAFVGVTAVHRSARSELFRDVGL